MLAAWVIKQENEWIFEERWGWRAGCWLILIHPEAAALAVDSADVEMEVSINRLATAHEHAAEKSGQNVSSLLLPIPIANQSHVLRSLFRHPHLSPTPFFLHKGRHSLQAVNKRRR